MLSPHQTNTAKLEWDLKNNSHAKINAYWQEKNYTLIPKNLFDDKRDIFLEIGAGSGAFFSKMATLYPEKYHIAVERDRMRGKTLVKKNLTLGLDNFKGVRGNVIPLLLTGVPDNRIERLYILYPCPWPKSSQRHNRWHLSAVMNHLVRMLKPGGLLIWASDQKWYIDEAHYVCEKTCGLKTLVHGSVSTNPYNDLANFPEGRTKFEKTFLAKGQSCHELILSKP